MKQLLFIVALMFSLLSTTVGAETAATSDKEQMQAVAENTVNINTADARTLAGSLSGVGSVKAQAIVDFREAHGPFDNEQELGKVQGVGPATIASNQGVIVVK